MQQRHSVHCSVYLEAVFHCYLGMILNIENIAFPIVQSESLMSAIKWEKIAGLTDDSPLVSVSVQKRIEMND